MGLFAELVRHGKAKRQKTDEKEQPGMKEQREAAQQRPQSPGEPAGGE
jgi:hypothetical protein